MRYFKIEDKDGNFSKGGFIPQWNKNGKMWNSVANLKKHFLQYLTNDYSLPKKYSDSTVVEYEVIIKEKRRTNLKEWIKNHE